MELPELLAKPGLEAATLTLVGDGGIRPELSSAFARLGVADRVEFTGQVEHRRVPELIAAADICIDPAPCSELNHRSTMIKVTEYLAAGRPVVAFELTETRRTAEDAALYAPCGDLEGFAWLIVRLAQSGDLRRELAERAVARAEELVWERSEEELLGAYERL